MTNNDELALKLKAAAEKALPAIEKYEAGEIDGDDALEMLSDFTDVIKPANILALLAERDADKKQLESWRSLAKKNIGKHEKAVIALDDARQRIADLEARTVSVKLPDCDYGAIQHMSGGSDDYCNGFVDGTQNAIKRVKADCAAAGIKLEVGE